MLDPRRVQHPLRVAGGHRIQIGSVVELELVEQLGAVTAHEVEEHGGRLADQLVGAAHVEPARQPGRVGDEVLEQERPGLGDRVVAEAAGLEAERRGRVREVLGVAGLVEQRAPVVDSSDRLDAQDDATGDVDGRAERARILARTSLDVEVDVARCAQVDAELRQRRLERCQRQGNRRPNGPTGAGAGCPSGAPRRARSRAEL